MLMTRPRSSCDSPVDERERFLDLLAQPQHVSVNFDRPFGLLRNEHRLGAHEGARARPGPRLACATGPRR